MRQILVPLVPRSLAFGVVAGILRNERYAFFECRRRFSERFAEFAVQIPRHFAVSDGFQSESVFPVFSQERHRFFEKSVVEHFADTRVDFGIERRTVAVVRSGEFDVFEPQFSFSVGFGFGFSGLFEDFERAFDVAVVIGMNAPRVFGVDRFEPLPKCFGPVFEAVFFKFGAVLPIRRNVRYVEIEQKGIQIEARTSTYDGGFSTRPNVGDGGVGGFNEQRNRIVFARSGDIEAVVGDFPGFFRGDFSGSDVHSFENLARVRRNDFARKALCQFERERGFSGCRRAVNGDDSIHLILCRIVSEWSFFAFEFGVFFLVVAVHDVLVPAGEGMEVFVEAHVAPVDRIVDGLGLGSFDIERGNDREALFVGDLVEFADVFFGDVGEFFA